MQLYLVIATEAKVLRRLTEAFGLAAVKKGRSDRNWSSCCYLRWSRHKIAAKPIGSWREVSMQRAIQSVLAAAILLGTASTTRAESVTKQCGEQWQAAKSAGTTNGATWPQFLPNAERSLVLELGQPFPRQLPPSLRLAPSFPGSSRLLLPQPRRPRQPLATKVSSHNVAHSGRPQKRLEQ